MIDKISPIVNYGLGTISQAHSKESYKFVYFDYVVVENISRIINSWKAKATLFWRQVKFNHIRILSVSIYTIYSVAVPKTNLQRLEQLMTRFLWSSKGDSQLQWVKWYVVCSSIENGRSSGWRLQYIRDGHQTKFMLRLWIILFIANLPKN